MKKILVTYATAGIGHKKAAVAVKKALDEINAPDTEVVLIDALDYTPPFFKWSYLKLYLVAVNKLSLLWGLSYYITDNFFVNIVISRLRRLTNWLNSKRLTEYLLSFKPDVIVSTHFFASEVVSDLKKQGIIDTKLVTVVTDYRLHSWWISDPTDIYVVSNDDTKGDLLRWRVEESKIKVLGIPVEPEFSKRQDKESIRARFGIEKGIFNILVIGGGFGVGPIEDIVGSIGAVSKPIQAVVICGHNEELTKRIESLKASMNIPMKVLGFVDNVYEYMEVADVVISKSGGITVSESLAKELPMVIISPIPGQESRNAGFILKYGAAVKLGKPSDIKHVLEDLIIHPEKLRAMKEVIERMRKPSAAADVAKLAIEMT